MKMKRVLVCTATAIAWLITPCTASAQVFLPPDSPVLGEQYHIEASGNLWMPSANIVVASEGFGILGDNVDLVKDLGVGGRKNFRTFRLVLRPAQKHKFKIQNDPLSYSGSSTLVREFKFNGLLYRVGLPVETQVDWKMWRVGYEYDFLYMDRGYAGFTVDARFMDAGFTLDSPIGVEFARARSPVPAIGFTGRYYPHPNISVTSELSFFRLPESVDQRYRASYTDFDIYGTVNFVRWAGAQFGYRRFNIDYQFKSDKGDLSIGGLYFAGVVRY
jgi:hypothetical protein